METILVKTKKWGNSLGIRLPKKTVKDNKLKPEEELIIQIAKPQVSKAKELFGILKQKEPIEKSMKDIDEALDF